MLNDVVQTACRDASGTNGELTREERIRSAASELVDYVCEYLLDDGIVYGTPLDTSAFRHIESLVATAMVAQYDADMKILETVVTDVIRIQRERVS
jgi:hypothetical protein